MIWFCFAITALLIANGILAYSLIRTRRVVKTLVETHNRLAVTVFRLVMVMSNQKLDDDSEDAPEDQIDDLLGGG